MGKISVLSKEVSELIAAGEVIDRPASVIKELLENSIDSGATLVTVEIKNGGRSFMRVSDNGSGISAEDVPTAFLRHATSKVARASDLDAVMTLGFRGEALASICAVASVDLLTKRREDKLGTHYRICGGEEKANEQTGCPDGTTIIVKDLFYNVPPRLKFLKKDVTEGNAVAAIVNKLALSHPEVSFKFIRDNKTELLTAGDGRAISAVYSVMGKEFASSMIPVDYSYEGIRVEGFVCKPLLAKANHSFQSFFINNRFVKSMTCMHAVDEAYSNLLMTGKVASCVIYLSLPAGAVDVNAHPTKLEVRFSNEKLIYDAVYFAVKNALMIGGGENTMLLDKAAKNFSQEQLRPTFTPEKPAEQMSFPISEECKAAETPAVSIVETAPTEQPKDDYRPEGARLYNRAAVGRAFESTADISGEQEFKYISEASFTKNAPPVSSAPKEEKREALPLRVIGEVFKTYIIAASGEDMFMIDKHAAHERFIFEKIKADVGALDCQLLIEPVMVQLSFEEYGAISENVEKVRQIGFDIEPDLAPTVAVKGVPLIIGGINPADVVGLLAQNFLNCKVDPQLDVFDELYHSLACKAAIKSGDNSAMCELEAVAKAVFENDNIRYCPHGRPVIIKLTKKDIEKQFRRIV